MDFGNAAKAKSHETIISTHFYCSSPLKCRPVSWERDRSRAVCTRRHSLKMSMGSKRPLCSPTMILPPVTVLLRTPQVCISAIEQTKDSSYLLYSYRNIRASTLCNKLEKESKKLMAIRTLHTLPKHIAPYLVLYGWSSQDLLSTSTVRWIWCLRIRAGHWPSSLSPCKSPGCGRCLK